MGLDNIDQNRFSSLTNQYSLSKTLRFELLPIGNTQQMLKDDDVFQLDKNIRDKYNATKPYFDRLHREFIKESLVEIELALLKNYQKVLHSFQAITRELPVKKKNARKKKLQDIEQKLRKQVVTQFDATATKWITEKYPEIGFKNSSVGFLFEKQGKGVFSLLKTRYGKEDNSFLKDDQGDFLYDENNEKISVFDAWKGFTGYFTKFFETRQNFYKSDGTATALATRIVDENLRRFCNNLDVFDKIKGEISKKRVKKSPFTEIEQHLNEKIKNVFTLKFYNKCILQDGIDHYNKVLGGETLDNGKHVRGINEVINKHRQDHPDTKLPYLKLLDKQILSEQDRFIDEIENNDELKERLKEFLETGMQKTKILKQLFKNFISKNSDYDLSEVYISKEAYERTVSRSWTSETERLSDALSNVLNEKEVRQQYQLLRKDRTDPAVGKKKDGKYRFPGFIKLQHIKDALENIDDNNLWKKRYYKSNNTQENKGVLTGEETVWTQFLQILEYEFFSQFEREIIDNKTGKVKLIGYDHSSVKLSKLLKNYNYEVGDRLSKSDKVFIKDFADDLLRIYQIAKYFAVEKKRQWLGQYDNLDSNFYENSKYGYRSVYYENTYEDIVQVYNKIRNYLTKKPWEDVQKWKLNFQNDTLAAGWDKNKEKDNFAIILRKGDQYFLGLMKKGSHHMFADKNKENFTQNDENSTYQKMVYKFFPDPAKMFPKVCFSKKGREFFKPIREICEIYEKKKYKHGDTFNVNDMQKLIDFYKICLTQYDGWQMYEFDHCKKTEKYTENIGEFYSDVAQDGYKLWFENVSENYVVEKNELGELYLFQIKNKDWNEGSTGTKNMHTLYFESLFSEENQKKSFVYKLNGGAEIFYRPKAIEKKKVKRNYNRKIIEKKRYTKDKCFFHVPITVNRAVGNIFLFNKKVNNFLAHNTDVNIIGVDRGEKHIAYYSVIDQNGQVLQDEKGSPVSGTLNHITNHDKNGNALMKNEKTITSITDAEGKITDYELTETGQKVPYTDYKLLLEYKERKRRIQRQSWQFVEGIKDLKKGYISQVVKKLADLAIKYNAIVVFEDLNMRFKQIRGGIEKSAYQQLEKALIDKLSFLVDKGETDPEKAGHLLKAYQLTAPVEAFKDMGKQTGILFYTTASYTSKIDPVTGWRKQIYLKSGNATNNKKNILKFVEIKFNQTENRFEFTYDLEPFMDMKQKPKKTQWTVCSSVERFGWNRKLNENKGGYDHYKNLTTDFGDLFSNHGINISEDIKSQIDRLEIAGNEKFFSTLIFLFNLVCQIRNTDPNTDSSNDADFILSPVADKDGKFFDSRKDNGDYLPKNGDDNGAFNIARKGIITLQKINEWSDENKKLVASNKEIKKSPDLFVSNIEWDDFVQS